jgi:hypothetical protein
VRPAESGKRHGAWRAAHSEESAIGNARGAAAVVAGYAIVAAASTQIPVDRTILQMGAYADMGDIVFTPAVPNLEGCTYTNGEQLAIVWSASPDSKAMYSTALAYLAGHKVRFGVSGCHSGGCRLRIAST